MLLCVFLLILTAFVCHLIKGLLTYLLTYLAVTYDDHLRLIGKRVVDFLLGLIELFC